MSSEADSDSGSDTDSNNSSTSGGNSSGEESEALKNAELEISKLKDELKKLQLNSNSQLVQSKNTNPRQKPKGVSEALNHQQEIALLGRKYSFMICPWADRIVLSDLSGRPDVDPLNEAHFDNRKLRKDLQIAELYDFIPQRLHNIMENYPKFSSIFRHHLQSTRSNAVLAVRQKAGLIFDLKQEYFETNYNRASEPVLQSLLKKPGETEYAFLAPVLFENGKYDTSMKTLFKNMVLPRIVRTILCGRSSTTKDEVSRPQTLAELWGVTSVTAGLIAFSAILARYMLTPEVELRRTGKATGIEWFEDFIAYKKLLLVKTNKTKRIFEFFNASVFGSPKIAAAPSNANPKAVELKNAMDAFMNDSESDGEEDLGAEGEDRTGDSEARDAASGAENPPSSLPPNPSRRVSSALPDETRPAVNANAPGPLTPPVPVPASSNDGLVSDSASLSGGRSNESGKSKKKKAKTAVVGVSVGTRRSGRKGALDNENDVAV